MASKLERGYVARMRERECLPRLALLFCALLLAAGSLGCGPDAASRRAADVRPNILLISMDTTRADHLSAYGYGRPTSRRLEALAAQGVRFERAYAPSATTGPSHASLFTSLYPMRHGVVKNGIPLDQEIETLAETLSGAGFDTASVVSSYVLSSEFGYDQGFARFDDDFSGAQVPSGTTSWEGREIEGKFYGSADDTTRRALAWLGDERDASRPFLLFVHYFDPHDPYLPPPGFVPPFEPGPKEQLKLNRTRFLYDVLLAFTDQEIGRLLDGLAGMGLSEDTLVIVTADHGEGLMQHGHMFHGVHLYEEGVRVPLILRWPGRLAAGRVEREPVALLDLAPTLLDVAEIAPSTAHQGRSLAPSLLSEDIEIAARPVFLYRRHYAGGEVAPGIEAKGEKFAIRAGRWKLIDGPAEASLELFDLDADPGETEDVASAHPDVVARLQVALRDWYSMDADTRKPLPELDPESRARLEALGYTE